jgi:L-fuculose-phosphate aldolase
MAKTLALPKDQLVKQALIQMQNTLADNTWTDRQKLALTCRILFESGHDSGLAGQITARGPQPGTYYTQQLGLGFDEITASNLLLVNEDLEVLEGHGMPNPANRFHSWVYRARPDVNCIIHTHPTHVAALSMLEVPLQVSHMDLCPLYDDCAFLEAWPGVPVGNEEGEIITGPWATSARSCFRTTASCRPAAHRRSLCDRPTDRTRRQVATAGDGRRHHQADPAGTGPRSP